MGNRQAKLSPQASKIAQEVFNMMDVDGSGSIDKQETLKFWFANQEVQFRETQHRRSIQSCGR